VVAAGQGANTAVERTLEIYNSIFLYYGLAFLGDIIKKSVGLGGISVTNPSRMREMRLAVEQLFTAQRTLTF